MRFRSKTAIAFIICGPSWGCSSPVSQSEDLSTARQAANVCNETVPANRVVDGIPAYAQCSTTTGAIYSNNGVDTATTPGTGWVRTQMSGGYQCTELAHRYLYFHWNVTWIPNGNAGTWCDTTPPTTSGVVQTTTPVHGDLIVFAPGSCGADATTGHVALVDVVNATSVTIVEQNSAGRRNTATTCAKCFLHVTANTGAGGAGGSSSVGGATSAGGATAATGGLAGTGGTRITGGSAAIGGGNSSSGGANSTGGTSNATGGWVGLGGALGTGGARPATGGRTNTGGANQTGGTTTVAGATGGVDSSTGGTYSDTSGPKPTGGSPSSSNTTGVLPNSGTGGTNAAETTTSTGAGPSDTAEGSCSCRAPGHSAHTPGLAALALMSAIGFFARRKNRRATIET